MNSEDHYCGAENFPEEYVTKCYEAALARIAHGHTNLSIKANGQL